MLPVERLAHERHDGRAAAAEQDGVDRHAGGVLPLGCDRRALGRGRGEARVRVRGRLVGVRASSRCRASRSRAAGGSLVMPSHQTSPSSVSAQLVKIEFWPDRRHRVRVRLLARAGRDAEEAGLGVDRVEAAVRRRTSSRRCRRRSSRPSSPASVGISIARLVLPHALGKAPVTYLTSPSGEVSLRISMCSAIQPSSRAITEAMRSAKHFLPSSALPP